MALTPDNQAEGLRIPTTQEKGRIMRYMTHQFTHVETLERARRWLVQSGIDRSRIEARTQGMLSLAVAVEGGESAEVQRIFDVAESSDPDGYPGIWGLGGRRHVDPQADIVTSTVATVTHSFSFVVGWHPQDADRELTQTDTGVELQKHFQEEKD